MSFNESLKIKQKQLVQKLEGSLYCYKYDENKKAYDFLLRFKDYENFYISLVEKYEIAFKEKERKTKVNGMWEYVEKDEETLFLWLCKDEDKLTALNKDKLTQFEKDQFNQLKQFKIDKDSYKPFDLRKTETENLFKKMSKIWCGDLPLSDQNAPSLETKDDIKKYFDTNEQYPKFTCDINFLKNYKDEKIEYIYISNVQIAEKKSKIKRKFKAEKKFKKRRKFKAKRRSRKRLFKDF